MIETGGLNLETFNKQLPEGEKPSMSSKYWKEIIRFIIYTAIMILLEVICGKYRSNGDSFDS